MSNAVVTDIEKVALRQERTVFVLTLWKTLQCYEGRFRGLRFNMCTFSFTLSVIMRLGVKVRFFFTYPFYYMSPLHPYNAHFTLWKKLTNYRWCAWWQLYILYCLVFMLVTSINKYKFIQLKFCIHLFITTIHTCDMLKTRKLNRSLKKAEFGDKTVHGQSKNGTKNGTNIA